MFLFVSALDSALSKTSDWASILLVFKLLSDMVLLALVFFMRPCSVGMVNHILISVWGINLLSTVTAVIAFNVDNAANVAPNVVFAVGTLVWVLARSVHLCYSKRKHTAGPSFSRSTMTTH